jgi:formylglycine-generating enzyme required for sulfatase activity
MENNFRDFKSAKEFVKELNLKDVMEWNEYCKSGNKPDDIPSDPENIYKNNGWTTMKTWLNITINAKSLPPFEEAVVEARKLAKIHNITGIETWRLACEGALIVTLTSFPYRTYRKEWKGIGYWLGNGKRKENPPLRVHRSFEEAKKFVRSLGLKSAQEWQDYCKSGNKPDDIPSNPGLVYKKRKKEK